RGALKLAGDLCAVYLDDPRCAAVEYRELVKRYPTASEAFEARERLGDLDMRIGDVKGALEAWRDQVATAPGRKGADMAQLRIARALLEQGQFHDARAAASELRSEERRVGKGGCCRRCVVVYGNIVTLELSRLL